MLGDMDNKYSNFVWEERKRYDGQGNNRFAFSLGQALRYYEYLLLVEERYKTASHDFISVLKQVQSKWKEEKHKISHTQKPPLEKRYDFEIKLHFEIESFYIFAKIFLDKLAYFLQDYFGSAQSYSIASHSKLVKNYRDFAKAKGIVNPNKLSSLAFDLQNKISEYRDKEITHHKKLRSIKGTQFNESSGIRIISTYLYPNDHEMYQKAAESKPISELLNLLRQYFDEVLSTVKENRNKSKFVVAK